ncbi:Protein of unknown function (DUF3099) [Prauserella flava]|nr:Protein of unknown function (DUF3099) [Prauserella flava]MCR3733004.1 Protein of unknown function (DUF3099) [Prauserella salsuginis]
MEERDRPGDPVLITEAAPSYDDELAARKRKYVLTMGMRFPCLVLAGVFYQTWWLALALLVLSIPLPWIAVLIANDRPPRKSEEVNRYHRQHRALEATPHQVIDVAGAAGAAGPGTAAPGAAGPGTSGPDASAASWSRSAGGSAPGE